MAIKFWLYGYIRCYLCRGSLFYLSLYAAYQLEKGGLAHPSEQPISLAPTSHHTLLPVVGGSVVAGGTGIGALSIFAEIVVNCAYLCSSTSEGQEDDLELGRLLPQ